MCLLGGMATGSLIKISKQIERIADELEKRK